MNNYKPNWITKLKKPAVGRFHDELGARDTREIDDVESESAFGSPGPLNSDKPALKAHHTRDIQVPIFRFAYVSQCFLLVIAIRMILNCEKHMYKGSAQSEVHS